MADADFPSDFERDIRRHERAVDEHRRRQELEAEVERLRAELERRTASLTAEVARLVVSRAALENRLEDLMDRWGSEREALVRAGAGAGDRVQSFVDAALAETLLRCIEELNGAIPGE
jgi:uncharacterized small protein (DUF1192 family)